METPQVTSQLKELLLQSLEHERGGVKVYAAALECAVHEDLKEEWEKYADQTQHHVEVLTRVCESLQLNPQEQTPGCKIVHGLGVSLVEAMQEALSAGNPDAAQIVACECVVLAETKDHLDWELIGKAAKTLKGAPAKTLQSAYDEIEDEEDEHLYHTRGWCRELWLQSLGIKAVLPPPEEKKHVKTAIGAARAEQTRRSPS
jgi:hypothetical protein